MFKVMIALVVGVSSWLMFQGQKYSGGGKSRGFDWGNNYNRAGLITLLVVFVIYVFYPQKPKE